MKPSLAVGCTGMLEGGLCRRNGARFGGQGRKQVILIVDDDEATRRLIELRLGHQGFPTASAESSRAALGLLRDGAKPCLVLFDVMMPGERGWDFVERLLKNPALSNVPVVLMSVNPTALEANRRIRGEERTLLLPKPLDVKRLVTLAASHCRCRLPEAAPR